MSKAAEKIPGYLLEPIPAGPTAFWESHHVTNPTAMRLGDDERVFLGYRAGGYDDYYRIEGIDVWRSHLGLAVLDRHGLRVTHRFPLPIMTLPLEKELPATDEAFARYQKSPYRDHIAVLHDFRFLVDGEWLFVIYHEGTLSQAYDCIVRMPVAGFRKRVEASIDLLQELADPEEIATEGFRNSWDALWGQDRCWEPAGVGGTNRIYPSPMTKNDIVFVRLADDSVKMYHRPVPDIAVVDTGGKFFLEASEDGLSPMGTLQSCIRPGFRDNSHIGNNGPPIKVKIGNRTVLMDIVHGVHNAALSGKAAASKWKMIYYPYLRLLDYVTGECLYYSQEPLLEPEGVWEEYTYRGAWVKVLPHLDAVIFAGGQVEKEPGCCALDDTFVFYCGLGDTAIGVGEFVLRNVLPSEVVEDIAGPAASGSAYPAAVVSYSLGEAEGWSWRLIQENGEISVERTLKSTGVRIETARRVLARRPGMFDAHGLRLHPEAIIEDQEIGWIVVYQGCRYIGQEAAQLQVGTGVLVLDKHLPERVLYRSAQPLEACSRLIGREELESIEFCLPNQAAMLVPPQVRQEIIGLDALQPLPSDMIKWLRQKAAAAGKAAAGAGTEAAARSGAGAGSGSGAAAGPETE